MTSPASPDAPFGPIPPPAATHPPFWRRRPPLRQIRAAAALLVAFGLGATTSHLVEGHRRVSVVALTPGPIAALTDGPAAVKGQVGDVFGSRFTLADDSGKTLVETGPRGDGGNLVKAGETVTVQGRFDHGALHAVLLGHADGHQDGLDAGPGPGGPPHHFGPHWMRAGF